eukprot:IDg4609t1
MVDPEVESRTLRLRKQDPEIQLPIVKDSKTPELGAHFVPKSLLGHPGLLHTMEKSRSYSLRRKRSTLSQGKAKYRQRCKKCSTSKKKAPSVMEKRIVDEALEKKAASLSKANKIEALKVLIEYYPDAMTDDYECPYFLAFVANEMQEESGPVQRNALSALFYIRYKRASDEERRNPFTPKSKDATLRHE